MAEDTRPVSAVALPERYEVLRVLGEGAMGTVMLARDRELKRNVAVKLLKPSADLARFRLEGRALAQLAHPGILRVLDAGLDGEQPYLVCEHLEGESLARVLARALPPVERALAIVAELAEALAHAHRAGILHRDVKPDNVMVTARGEVKLLDFGLARAPGAGVVTAPDLILGTPHYMAPEVVAGEAVGPAADQFSLGVLAFLALTGELPFRGESPADIAAARLTARAPAPSRVRRGLPAGVDDLVGRALARAPADRFPGLDELAAAARALARRVPAAPTARVERPARWHLGWMLLAAVVMVAVVTAHVRRPVDIAPSPSLSVRQEAPVALAPIADSCWAREAERAALAELSYGDAAQNERAVAMARAQLTAIRTDGKRLAAARAALTPADPDRPPGAREQLEAAWLAALELQLARQAQRPQEVVSQFEKTGKVNPIAIDQALDVHYGDLSAAAGTFVSALTRAVRTLAREPEPPGGPPLADVVRTLTSLARLIADKRWPEGSVERVRCGVDPFRRALDGLSGTGAGRYREIFASAWEWGERGSGSAAGRAALVRVAMDLDPAARDRLLASIGKEAALAR